jgi:RNase P subunit RPR2
MYLRYNVYKRLDIEFSPEEKVEIEQSIKLGVCQICGRTMTPRNSHIDHNHKNNKFRGVICSHCNLTLGMMKDDINYLEQLISYLKRNQ